MWREILHRRHENGPKLASRCCAWGKNKTNRSSRYECRETQNVGRCKKHKPQRETTKKTGLRNWKILEERSFIITTIENAQQQNGEEGRKRWKILQRVKFMTSPSSPCICSSQPIRVLENVYNTNFWMIAMWLVDAVFRTCLIVFILVSWWIAQHHISFESSRFFFCFETFRRHRLIFRSHARYFCRQETRSSVNILFDWVRVKGLCPICLFTLCPIIPFLSRVESTLLYRGEWVYPPWTKSFLDW